MLLQESMYTDYYLKEKLQSSCCFPSAPHRDQKKGREKNLKQYGQKFSKLLKHTKKPKQNKYGRYPRQIIIKLLKVCIIETILNASNQGKQQKNRIIEIIEQNQKKNRKLLIRNSRRKQVSGKEASLKYRKKIKESTVHVKFNIH